MGFLTKVKNFLTGGLGEKIVEGIQAYFPPSMSESEKANLQLAIKQITHQHEVELQQLAAEQDQEFNDRIRDLEGTARDLTQFGWLGRIVVFLRGCQRPIWGGLVMYIDVMWFSGSWPTMTKQQESALWIINLLVLGFLFGERAVKNVMPLIIEMIAKRAAK
ncbi:hypothetical protein [Pseudidiomarina aestuarii]|uniref:hypothetical protein n=1 Tax=Pseudidiomarina aestuarii TaxID=624146 RepID=UPI003A971FA9